MLDTVNGDLFLNDFPARRPRTNAEAHESKGEKRNSNVSPVLTRGLLQPLVYAGLFALIANLR